MKTFATNEKHSTPAGRKARPYAHHPIEPAQQSQQAAMRKILRPNEVQAKPDIGEPDGKHEQEVDHVADRVATDLSVATISGISPGMSGGNPSFQRSENEESVQAKPLADQITPLVQRQEESLEEEVELQAKSKPGETSTVTPNLESRINSMKGGGQPLNAETRAFFEPRFGHDLSQVRVHTGARAEESARDVNAKAFTLGRDVVFGAGQYSSGSSSGRRLLAHELTHTIQQRGAVKTVHIQRTETKAEQAKRLKEVNNAALTAAVAETKVSTAKPHWAKTLSSSHLTNLSKVINYLNTAITDLKTGAKKVDAARASLTDAIKNINKLREKINWARAQGYGETGFTIQYLGKAKNAIDVAGKLLKESKAKGIDGLDKWIKKVSGMSAKIDTAKSAFLRAKTVDLSKLSELRDAIKKIRTDFMLVRNKFIAPSLAAPKIQFVLRYFLALNMAGYAKGPSLKEAAAIRTKLGSVASDMALIFGGSASDYELFRGFESQLQEQIWVRSEMKKALGTDPGLKPSESDVVKWFKGLKNASNTDVIEAYRKLASGFFIHRHEADPSVVASKQTLNSIFTRTSAISGARLAVCSGFAVLGKGLLEAAGSKFKNYYIGLRAGNTQIKCSTDYSDVHALAHLTRMDPTTRKSLNMYISNDDIVFNKNSGLGPTAVAWADKTNPIYEGVGKTLTTATRKALMEVAKKRKTLGKISCQ